MKYLVHLPPSAALQEKLIACQRELGNQVLEEVSVPHCTLMAFYSEPHHEETFKELLAGIAAKTPRFPWRTDALARFSNSSMNAENILVLKMERPDTLLSLHKQVIATLSSFATDARGQTHIGPYSGDAYGPHFSICVLQNASDTAMAAPQEEWIPDSVLISRKVSGGHWVTIAAFSLAKPF